MVGQPCLTCVFTFSVQADSVVLSPREADPGRRGIFEGSELYRNKACVCACGTLKHEQ